MRLAEAVMYLNVCVLLTFPRSTWLNRQRSLAVAQPVSNFREQRKNFNHNNPQSSKDVGKKKRKKPPVMPVIELKTDQELMNEIDFSCLDTPRSEGEWPLDSISNIRVYCCALTLCMLLQCFLSDWRYSTM